MHKRKLTIIIFGFAVTFIAMMGMLIGGFLSVETRQSETWVKSEDKIEAVKIEPYINIKKIEMPTEIIHKETVIKMELSNVGDKISDSELEFNDGTTKSITDFEGWKVIHSIPSIVTKICSMQTLMLDGSAGDYDNVTFINVSQDTPSVIKKHMESSHLTNILAATDSNLEKEFSESLNVYISSFGINTRSIFIVNPENEIAYVEYAHESGHELDLSNVITYLNQYAK